MPIPQNHQDSSPSKKFVSKTMPLYCFILHRCLRYVAFSLLTGLWNMLKSNELDADCAGTVLAKGAPCYMLHSNTLASLQSAVWRDLNVVRKAGMCLLKKALKCFAII